MPRHFVHLSKATLTQLLLNGFEAFAVKHKGQKRIGIEMWGSLYGRTEKKRGEMLHHYIEFISVDTSAKMKPGSVTPHPLTQLLKESLAADVGFDLLGGVHTHPYLQENSTLQEVRKYGCDFSDADKNLFTSHLLDQQGERTFLVQLLFTIRKSQRRNTVRDGRIARNLFEFSVGNSKCFLRAQVFALDEADNLIEVSTTITSDYLSGYEQARNAWGKSETRNRSQIRIAQR